MLPIGLQGAARTDTERTHTVALRVRTDGLLKP